MTTKTDRTDFLLRLLTDDELWLYWQLLNDPELFDDQAEADGRVH